MKLLDDLTYRWIMKNLKRAKKASVNGEGWRLIRVNPSVVKMLTALGLDPSTDAGVPEMQRENHNVAFFWLGSAFLQKY